ncbi:hypothetical protein Pryu01_00473 [Paraliobacillus ryukyuensis]|uniref:Uncharacterized protein n=1 Tax=Paraliobacillus ryukyuensis TaxID=200904 RepID=A0A366EGE3_9BACI|nr:hypothetical protein [Paraliobacillus ryukyuensis]RBP01454.1 hypothetical protein DES48_101191 [Paraliobacillus ryukyuensis]
MPIQNKHEIEELCSLSKKLEAEAHQAQTHADAAKAKELHTQLQKVLEHIHQAQGKAMNGDDTSAEPLYQAQLRVAESNQQMEKLLTNLHAQKDSVQP